MDDDATMRYPLAVSALFCARLASSSLAILIANSSSCSTEDVVDEDGILTSSIPKKGPSSSYEEVIDLVDFPFEELSSVLMGGCSMLSAPGELCSAPFSSEELCSTWGRSMDVVGDSGERGLDNMSTSYASLSRNGVVDVLSSLFLSVLSPDSFVSETVLESEGREPSVLERVRMLYRVVDIDSG